MITIGSAAARRIALAAQGFDRPSKTPSPTHVTPAPDAIPHREHWPARSLGHLRKAMDRMQLLQLDSVPVVTRSQYLPLYSRLGPYDPALLDRIAYQRGEWFETWAHEASLAPVTLEPWLRVIKHRAAAGHTWGNLHRLASEQPDYVERVHAQVAERGPLTAAELDDPRRPQGGTWWATRSQGAMALDWLYRVGRLGIRRRGNFEKAFDLIERIVPCEILATPTPSPEDALRELLRRASTALGVATAEDLIDYFRLPPTLARPRLPELVEAGELIACQVRGWKRPAYLARTARNPRRIRARALLSPFDPVVWNRDRAARLFHFDYRLEIYTPASTSSSSGRTDGSTCWPPTTSRRPTPCGRRKRCRMS